MEIQEDEEVIDYYKEYMKNRLSNVRTFTRDTRIIIRQRYYQKKNTGIKQANLIINMPVVMVEKAGLEEYDFVSFKKRGSTFCIQKKDEGKYKI